MRQSHHFGISEGSFFSFLTLACRLDRNLSVGIASKVSHVVTSPWQSLSPSVKLSVHRTLCTSLHAKDTDKSAANVRRPSVRASVRREVAPILTLARSLCESRARPARARAPRLRSRRRARRSGSGRSLRRRGRRRGNLPLSGDMYIHTKSAK